MTSTSRVTDITLFASDRSSLRWDHQIAAMTIPASLLSFTFVPFRLSLRPPLRQVPRSLSLRSPSLVSGPASHQHLSFIRMSSRDVSSLCSREREHVLRREPERLLGGHSHPNGHAPPPAQRYRVMVAQRSYRTVPSIAILRTPIIDHDY